MVALRFRSLWVNNGDTANRTARLIRLSSSRTLPGHEWESMEILACSVKPEVSTRISSECCSRKKSASGNISSGHSERGLAYLKLGETVVQILPETSLLYGTLHILVGSRQYPYIGFKFFAAAHWTIHSFLQYPEQQCLHFWRHVSDLVKEERTALGRLKIPGSILFRIGKRPCTWPKNSDAASSPGYNHSSPPQKACPYARYAVGSAVRQILSRYRSVQGS